MAPPIDPEENSKKIIPVDQIAAAARAGGWTGQDVVIATAVALAESSGDRTAVGRAVPSRPDYGLWQVNYIHADKFPGFFPPGVGWKGITSNAIAAKKVWDSQQWNAWTVFKSGTYRNFLKAAQDGAAQNTKLPDIPPPDPILTDPWLGEAVNNLNPFKDYENYLWIAGGAVLVLLGVVLLAKDSDIGKAAIGVASKGVL